MHRECCALWSRGFKTGPERRNIKHRPEFKAGNEGDDHDPGV